MTPVFLTLEDKQAYKNTAKLQKLIKNLRMSQKLDPELGDLFSGQLHVITLTSL